MRKSRFWQLAVMLLAFGLLTAGCFQIRVFFMAPRALGVGETAQVKIVMTPYGLDFLQSSKVVVLVGTQDLDFRSVGKFDKAGQYGGPYANVRNDGVRDHLLAGGNCTAFGIDAADLSITDWVAYVTVDNVDTTGLSAADLSKQFLLRIRVDRSAGTDSGGAGHLVVISAWWADANGNGVYDPTEGTVCTGMVMSSVSFIP